MSSKTYIMRLCSRIIVQNMTGYFIREDDMHSGDITFLQDIGYHVYGIRRAHENKPYTIERRVLIHGRAGIVVFLDPIIFPDRRYKGGITRSSLMNYYTLNNQYSRFDPEIIKIKFSPIIPL